MNTKRLIYLSLFLGTSSFNLCHADSLDTVREYVLCMELRGRGTFECNEIYDKVLAEEARRKADEEEAVRKKEERKAKEKASRETEEKARKKAEEESRKGTEEESRKKSIYQSCLRAGGLEEECVKSPESVLSSYQSCLNRGGSTKVCNSLAEKSKKEKEGLKEAKKEEEYKSCLNVGGSREECIQSPEKVLRNYESCLKGTYSPKHCVK